MKIGLDLDDTLINTRDKIKICWKDYYNKHPNKDYTEEIPYNINLFGFDYIEEFWNIYREDLFCPSFKKNSDVIIKRLQKDGHYIGLITSRPSKKYNNLVPRIKKIFKDNNIVLDEIVTDIVDKAEFLQNTDYDMLIDDSINHIEKVLKIGKKGILFNETDKKDIKHTTSWQELYKLIEEYK